MINDNAKRCVFILIRNIDETGFIPTQQISLLEQSLEEARSASMPKPKFAFKRKANKPQRATAPSLPPSSRSANELGEGDAVPSASTFHKFSSHTHSRLSLQSISTLVAGTPSFDLTISDLDRCIVDLCGTAGTVSPLKQLSLTALHARDLRDTILILPNVQGSILLHNLHRCTVIVSCHQAGILSSMW
jgi:tubulin-specific chaperone C